MRDEWVLSRQGVWATAVFVTALALLENTVVPWAPFFVSAAAVSMLVPLLWRTYRFGSIRALPWRYWLMGAVTAVLLTLVARQFLIALMPSLFGGTGVETDAILALEAVLEKAAAEKWNTSPQTLRFAYVGFIVLYGSVGEELFYRGYLHGQLNAHEDVTTAVVGSAVFFALRRAAQLALLWPAYPGVAATAWMLFSFGFGVALSLIYEQTRSLYVPIFVHLVFNLLFFFAGA